VTDVVVGAAIVRAGRLLVAQRAYPESLAGRWELPGGKVEAGEDEPAALARECREELGVELVVGQRVGGDLTIPGGRLLRVYEASTDDEPTAHEHVALAWVPAGELEDLDWLPADRPLVPALRELLAR
jgi:8-oxo-dGTP diphosphatase